ncbi:T9SS type A sorting domain-containing protein [Crocinitomix catalasitica]|nr:T9SS type A sorting domain-containing protein [Crocinitomix catalasitica]
MKSVKIETPCHEDWSKMAPSQKGAFCDSCQIDVIDFSTRSKEEVKSILLANEGKHMCGRFSKAQLVELNTDYTAWENQSTSIFQSKFLYACLLVFGMTLFTGCIEDEQIMGEIAIENYETLEETDAYVQGGYKVTTEDKHQKGKVKYTPPPKDTTKKPVQELHVKGEIIATDILMGDTIVNQIKDLIVPVDPIGPPDSVETWEYFEMGDIAVDPSFYEHLVDTVTETTTPDTLENKTPIIEIYPNGEEGTNVIASKSLSISVFPNPTADVAAIVLNVPKTELFEIRLLDLSGRHLQDIYSGIIPKGIKRFEIELSTYESGTFLVVINANSTSQTVQVQKVQ